VAAAQASQHNSATAVSCRHCGLPLAAPDDSPDDSKDAFLARHICRSCGAPQPVSKEENYFQALGAPAKFSQDQALLQKRFYEVSRALHPDRFTSSGEDAKRFSLERMSFLNDAYRTLKSPGELRDYILKLHGLKAEAGARGQIPMDLAEGWFELQDVLAEDPDQASEKLKSFKIDLEKFRQDLRKKISEAELKLDSLNDSDAEYRTVLQDLSRTIQEESYLHSLGRDVERIEQRMLK
jgi:molecular chaperone HscB